MGDIALCELVMQLRGAYDFPMTHLLADGILDADSADRGRTLLRLVGKQPFPFHTICSHKGCQLLVRY